MNRNNFKKVGQPQIKDVLLIPKVDQTLINKVNQLYNLKFSKIIE